MLVIFNHYDPVTVYGWKKTYVSAHSFVNYLEINGLLIIVCILIYNPFYIRSELSNTQRKNPDITTSYVHCVTQGFFFCNREVCSPGTVSLLMLTTQQVLTTGEHTHIHHNGQSTCELRQSLVLHFFSLFVFAGVQKTIERTFQPDRRVSSFSLFLYCSVKTALR